MVGRVLATVICDRYCACYGSLMVGLVLAMEV